MTDDVHPTPAPAKRVGCLTWVLVAVAVGVVLGLILVATDNTGDSGPTDEQLQRARDMCDTNAGGSYHVDQACVDRYLGR